MILVLRIGKAICEVTVLKKFYLSNEFLNMIEPWLFGRELWFGQGSLRPLKACSIEEFKVLVSRLRLNDPFPFFFSVETFSDPSMLEKEDPNKLRINWDFFLDLDSEDFEAARRAAHKASQTLLKFNIENYLLKFSGRRGFHLFIPGLSLDIFHPGEFQLAYPRLAVMLAKFFEAVINEPKVKIDLAVYKARQLMRAPYSYHEKTGLLSVPVNDPLSFKIKRAKLENVKVRPFFTKGNLGEARKLLEAVRDWWKDHNGREEPGLKILSYGKASVRKVKQGYGWIERLLDHPVDDGRHRLLWLVIAPYLVNVKELPLSEAIKQSYNYLIECSKVKLVEGDLHRLAEYYVEYAGRIGLKPLSLQTLKTKSEYKDLYEIIKHKLADRGKNEIAAPSTKIFQKVSRKLKIRSLNKLEAEYEVEPALIEGAKAIVKDVLDTFQSYPHSKHWKRDEERNLMFGWLAEKIFDMTLNQLKIPHVWNHPLLQNERIRGKKKAEEDFIVNDKTIDVKASTEEERPEYFYINRDRWLKHSTDYVVFIRFSPDLKRAWIMGWIEGRKVESYPVAPLPYSPAYKIPRTDLKPFRTLLEALKQ